MPTDPQLEAYLHDVAARITARLGPQIVGLWRMGSTALGGYDPQRSDIDLLLVTRDAAPVGLRREVAAAIDPAGPAGPAGSAASAGPAGSGLPCPALGLEFVWYAQDDVRPLGDPPAFQLNLNGGRARAHRVQLGPGAEAAHWFVIDLAIGRDAAVPVIGPPLADVAGPIPPERLLPALRESLGWHDRFEAGSANRALNAARATVYLGSGRWVAKPEAARRLAATHPELAPALAAAVEARATGRPLAPELGAQVARAARAAIARSTGAGQGEATARSS